MTMTPLPLTRPDEVLARRRKAWQPPTPRYTRGVLAKYAKPGCGNGGMPAHG